MQATTAPAAMHVIRSAATTCTHIASDEKGKAAYEAASDICSAYTDVRWICWVAVSHQNGQHSASQECHVV